MRTRKALQLALVFAAVFTLLYLRRPTNLTRPQFWAEDGAVFFSEQLVYGGQAVFHTYAGYLHLIPRCVAFIADKFDPSVAPLVYCLSALTLAALSCTAISADAFHEIMPSQTMRVSLSLLMATIAQCDESIGNIANVQWWLLIPALLFAWLPARRGAWHVYVGWAMVGLLLALTAPGSIIAAPLVLLLAFRRRSISAYQVGLLLGLAIQIGVLLTHPNTDPKTPIFVRVDQTITATLHALGNQVILPALVGHKFANQMIGHGYLSVGFVCLIAAFVVVTAQWYRPKSTTLPANSAIPVAFGLLLLSLSLSMFFRVNLREIFQASNHYLDLMADRYFLLPSCLLAFLAASLIRDAAIRSPGIQVAVLLLVFSMGVIYNFRVRSLQDLHWEQFAPAVRQWKADRESHRAGPALSVPINPPQVQIGLPPPEQTVQ